MIPIIINHLERGGLLRRRPRLEGPIQVALLGVCLTFATPLCCAIFEQRASIAVDKVEPDLAEKIRRAHPAVKHLYYNKGL